MDSHQDDRASRSSRARLPVGIWALGFVSLLMDVSSEMIHSLLPVFLVAGLGASALVVGLIDGAAEATAQIVKIFSGALSDYWGRRKPLAVAGYGLGALAKPLFALASGPGTVLVARIIDRIGKGVRGAPRDALIAAIAPAEVRGAAFGLRQSLDTVGAALGPALAIVLMLSFNDDFRAVFWVATIPAVLCVGLLAFGVREPAPSAGVRARNPIRRDELARLPAGYWQIVVIGALFALARFSEAFLVLRGQDGGLALALTPLVLIVMNLVFALAAYPIGRLTDGLAQRYGEARGHRSLLAPGLAILILADLALAAGDRGAPFWLGITLWGLHMGMTQGLLATMVAASAPAELRGTAFGIFNLASGVAVLAGSVLAGVLWDRFGATTSFLVGAGFAACALLALLVLIRADTRLRREHDRTPS